MIEILVLLALIVCHWPLIMCAFIDPGPSMTGIFVVGVIDFLWNWIVIFAIYHVVQSWFDGKVPLIAVGAYIAIAIISFLASWFWGGGI